MIYLDNSATTYPKPECVYEQLDYANRNLAFNAGRGSYSKSVEAMKIIDSTRELIGDYVGISHERVIFTSSATESLNMIVKGLSLTKGDDVYVSVFEHNAVIRPLYATGANIHIIPFNKETWKLEEEKLSNVFAVNNPKAVFLSHVSNVTGYVLPYEQIFEQSKKYNAVNVLDCAQSFGILKPETSNLNYIVFAGHKSMYGPFGAAGFIKCKDDEFEISKFGGTGSDSLNPEMPVTFPGRLEAGSSNVVAISGMKKGFEWTIKNEVAKHEYELTEYLVNELRKIKGVHVFIPENVETLGIVSIAIDGYQSSDVSSILSEDYEICTRSGYHCAPLIHDFIGSKEFSGTIRISMGAFNKKEDIDFLIKAVKEL